jgi:hypothetical protein
MTTEITPGPEIPKWYMTMYNTQSKWYMTMYNTQSMELAILGKGSKEHFCWMSAQKSTDEFWRSFSDPGSNPAVLNVQCIGSIVFSQQTCTRASTSKDSSMDTSLG